MTDFDFELFVIGAGSGGVRAARTAANLGIRVAIAEDRHLGGTCVNVGCVPKKLFVYASHFREDFEAAKGFGWSLSEPGFDWPRLLSQKDRELERLRGIYGSLLDKSGVTLIEGRATLLDAHTVQVGETRYRSERILIATGGKPFIPDFPGNEHVADSDDMFALDKLPKRLLIVGGGYIAVEFASIMHGMGVNTTLCYRGEQILRGFDHDVRAFADQEMRKKGIDILLNTNIQSVTRTESGYEAHTDRNQIVEADLILYATGRKPNTAGLGLSELGVALTENGEIVVDDRYQSNIPSIYALGDVTGGLNLTPVATAEAMALVNNLYTDKPTSVDYNNIPTAVFSQPNIGTVGLTESEAKERYSDIEIYKSVFTPMKHTLSGLDEKTMMKMIVRKSTDRVLGIHMVGPEAGEIIQGMAVAIRAGATKAVFDSTIGIHPTAAEEFVTMRKSAG
ncbi:MAG: glutathione-disulfide reductase [Gammaproteobacteria bacterium]|nr:glutathione-disulfide reductase [Gammaproteobacteria bacterium]